ncbi:MAG TPA: dienelactone hydrolase family protein, partial [Candidatus Bathyarchaeia archaeon]|nr:dienelactone hydrolase family protein [Candidatus Bathyarchaeia archaeon]
MRRRTAVAVILGSVLAGCASGGQSVSFPNVTPQTPIPIDATLFRPAGDGPFPAVVQLHGCG